MLKRNTDRRIKGARGRSILRNAAVKMKLGYRCSKKHSPKHMEISAQLKEASQGTSFSLIKNFCLLIQDSEAIEDLTGGVTTELFTTDILDKEKFWTDEIMQVNKEFLFGCATGTFDRWQGSDVASNFGARDHIIRMHAYSIMEAKEIKGQRLLRIR